MPSTGHTLLRIAAADVLRESAAGLVIAHGLLTESGVDDTTGYLVDTAVILVDFAHALNPLTAQEEP
jgi:hypothetical protein